MQKIGRGGVVEQTVPKVHMIQSVRGGFSNDGSTLRLISGRPMLCRTNRSHTLRVIDPKDVLALLREDDVFKARECRRVLGPVQQILTGCDA
jgi:hypothetical protein